jgi:hypothetical protein
MDVSGQIGQLHTRVVSTRYQTDWVGPRAGLGIVETSSLGILKHKRNDNIKTDHKILG